MKKPDSFILVIFGGSGDLARRKLLPVLFDLFKNKLLPDHFAILGLGRTKYDDKTYRQYIFNKNGQSLNQQVKDKEAVDGFAEHLFYMPFDMTNADDYGNLSERISTLDKQWSIKGNYLFYLATAPGFYEQVTDKLHQSNLTKVKNSESWRRVILEKPFGHDLESARALNKHLLKIFDEEQIYRIDHYLGKETVQNILAFRFANGIFEPLWNRNYIHHVEITTAESIGVENRGGYYDNSGALRDMVQNHLLQVASIVAMEPPAKFDAESIRDEKSKVFKSLRKMDEQTIANCVVRGQYIESTVRGNKQIGYRDENKVDRDSLTETYVALKFFIDNWRWGGVPFYIRTGKRLPTRVTEIVIYFKETPYQLFKHNGMDHDVENMLVLRVQPDEGILLKFGMKIPGAGYNIKNVGMDFHYSDLTDTKIPEAYERLLLDALIGDSTLYGRADSVEDTWKFIDPILKVWQSDPSIKLYGYPAGTWGPPEARSLFDSKIGDWRYPCKNLTNEDTYCEL